MNYGAKVTSLFVLLAAACGDNESMTTGTSVTTAASVTTMNPATTNSTPSSDTQDDTSATDATTSNPTTSTTSVEGAPVFLSFSANVATLTQDESVTFTATLTDPDGVADIVGGSLYNADESLQFGPFVAAGQPGTYSITLTWGQIHQTETIEFDNGSRPRGFRAVFFDQAGHKATDDAELTLVCAGGTACDGICTDLGLDALNCGQCGNACDAGACESGMCAPTYSPCTEEEDGAATCAEVCQLVGEMCVAQGCGGATVKHFDTANDCELSLGAAYGQVACDEVHDWNINAKSIQCCCTDTK